MMCNFNKVAMQLIEITRHYGCSPVSWLHIFRTHFHRNTPGRLLLVLPNLKIDNLNHILERYLWRGSYLVNQILERYLWRGSYLVKLQALLKNDLFWKPTSRNTFDRLFMKIVCTTHFTLAYMLKLFSHWIIVPITWCSAQWRIEIYPWLWNIWRFLGKAHALLLISRRWERKTLMLLRVGVCCWRMAVG